MLSETFSTLESCSNDLSISSDDQLGYIEIGTDVEAGFFIHHIVEFFFFRDFLGSFCNIAAHFLDDLVLCMLKNLIELILVAAKIFLKSLIFHFQSSSAFGERLSRNSVSSNLRVILSVLFRYSRSERTFVCGVFHIFLFFFSRFGIGDAGREIDDANRWDYLQQMPVPHKGEEVRAAENKCLRMIAPLQLLKSLHRYVGMFFQNCPPIEKKTFCHLWLSDLF